MSATPGICIKTFPKTRGGGVVIIRLTEKTWTPGNYPVVLGIQCLMIPHIQKCHGTLMTEQEYRDKVTWRVVVTVVLIVSLCVGPQTSQEFFDCIEKHISTMYFN